MRIYISGAITGTEDFRERFLKAEKELIAAGYDTVNPARLNDIMPKNATHGEYMRMSFELLDLCDAIYMLDGFPLFSKEISECIEYGRKYIKILTDRQTFRLLIV